MTKEKIILVGNGTAAHSAAKAIRDTNKDIEIVIYGDEPSLSYHRPMLTKALLSNRPIEKLLIKPASWYEEQNIVVHMECVVARLDASSRTIHLDDGQEDTYDKLILTTGATSFIPPIPGSHLPGVYAIRSYADMKQIEEAATQVKQVVVIGGGVLGLEAAWQFHKQNIQVTILELAPKLMVRQLDDITSDSLAATIVGQGMEVMVGVNIEAILGDTRVVGVRLGDGKVIDADMVLMSTGIRANVTLAKEAGLTINKAIVVNDLMETSEKYIYAAGDCAEFEGINYGILPEAQAMGVVAGTNAAGGRLRYETVLPAILFHGMNTQLYAIGDVGKDASKTYDIKVIEDKEKKTFARYYFVGGILSGAVLFGDTKDMKRIGLAFEQKASIEELFPND